MAEDNSRAKKIEIIFATYPEQVEVFMCSDDRAFFKKHDAEGYAQGLEDNTVEHVPNPSFVEAPEVLEEETAPEASEEENAPETEAEPVAEEEAPEAAAEAVPEVKPKKGKK
jgi:hypothetical protein